MIFNTSWFLVFFLVAYPLFLLVPTARLRLWFLLAASAVFHYHFAGPAGIRPIAVMAAFTWGLALLLPRASGRPGRRLLLAAALAVPVSGLVAYKYRALLAGSLASLLPASALPAVEPYLRSPALPLAISFFTFEFVHYLVDVSRGSEPVRNPLRFGLFCIYFPSIVSGPIKRFQPFLAQFQDGAARPRPDQAASGAAQVLLGFFKKLVVADNAAIAIGLLDKHPSPTPASVAVLLALLSVRILFDFSGYSDIAIGLSRMMGIEIPRNFAYPYAARNIAEFWQRWHMSLSSWIRDYVYIPLGGNRRGGLLRFLNLSVTMFLCGLWHGPAWHFGLWGLYHGVGLGLHYSWSRSPLALRLAALPGSRWIGAAVNNVFVAWGWLLFFYPVPEAVRLTRALVGL